MIAALLICVAGLIVVTVAAAFQHHPAIERVGNWITEKTDLL